MGDWDGFMDSLKDAPRVTISGYFDTDKSTKARHDAHMSVCTESACNECGMAPCGEYHHLGPRGNGACNESWCTWGDSD